MVPLVTPKRKCSVLFSLLLVVLTVLVSQRAGGFLDLTLCYVPHIFGYLCCCETLFWSLPGLVCGCRALEKIARRSSLGCS